MHRGFVGSAANMENGGPPRPAKLPKHAKKLGRSAGKQASPSS
jgi:hypothetical protein